MPRPNKPRTIRGEAYLAQRIAIERHRRGWTYDGLAQRMTNAGCPIQSSALYKTEKHARRIVFDEALALAEVFGIPLADLGVDPDLFAEKAVIEHLTRWWAAVDQLRKAQDKLLDELDRTTRAIADLTESSPAARKAARAYSTAKAGEIVQPIEAAFARAKAAGIDIRGPRRRATKS